MNRIQLIKKVMKEFDKNNIGYCILRNYGFLLKNKKKLLPSEKSVDMVISRKDENKLDKLLTKLNFTKRKKGYSRKHVPYFRIGKEIVSFDIQIGAVHWNDMPYLDEKYILKNRIKKSFFYVPSDDDTFVMLLVHSILGKRHFKPEYKRILSSLSSAIDRVYVFDRLKEIFNKKNAEILLHLALHKKFNEIIKKKNYLIPYFISKSPQHMFIFIRLFFRWIGWKRLLIPAPLITIVGPDGSGKSTIVNGLTSYLKENGRRVQMFYGGRGRNQILPIKTIGDKYKSSERKRDKLKKSNRTARKVLYILAAPIFTLDLFLRYWFRIFPKRIKKHIVVTDRYSSDIVLMDYISLKFKKFLLWFFPKPTISILLYNSPEILHKRRPEEPTAELKRQLNIFNKFSYSLKIKTSNKEQDSKQAIEFIFKRLLYDWY